MLSKKGVRCKTSSSSSSSVKSIPPHNAKQQITVKSDSRSTTVAPTERQQRNARSHEPSPTIAAPLLRDGRVGKRSATSSISSQDGTSLKPCEDFASTSRDTVWLDSAFKKSSSSNEDLTLRGSKDLQRKPLKELEQETGGPVSNPASVLASKSGVFVKPRVPPTKKNSDRGSQMKKCASVQNVSSNSKNTLMVPKSSSGYRRPPSTEHPTRGGSSGAAVGSSTGKKTSTSMGAAGKISLEDKGVVIVNEVGTVTGDVPTMDAVVLGPSCCSEFGDLPSSHHPHVMDSTTSNTYSVNLDLVSRMEKDKKAYESHIGDLQTRLENKTRDLDRAQHKMNVIEKQMGALREFCDSLSQRYVEVRSVALEHNLITAGNVPAICDLRKRMVKADVEPPSVKEDEDATGDETLVDKVDGMETLVQEAVSTSEDPILLVISSEPNGLLEATEETKVSEIRRWQETSHHAVSNEWAASSAPPANSDDAQSAVSMADLQGRLTQLQEHQYSTNEELQATLQELCEMQKATDDVKMQHQETLKEQQILYETIQEQRDREKRLRRMLHTLRCLLTAPKSRPLLINSCANSEEVSKVNSLLDYCQELEEDKQNFMALNDELATAYESLLLESKSMRDRCESLVQQKMVQEQQHSVEMQCLEAEVNQERNMRFKLESTHYFEMENLEKQLHEVSTELQQLKEIHQNVSQECENMKMERERVHALEEKWRETHGRQENEVISLREQCKSLERDCCRLDSQLNQAQKRNTYMEQRLQKSQECEADSLRRVQELERDLEERRRDWESYEKDLLKVICVAEEARVEAVDSAEALRKELANLKTQLASQSSFTSPPNSSSAVCGLQGGNECVIPHSGDMLKAGLTFTTPRNVNLMDPPTSGTSHGARLSSARLLATTRLGGEHTPSSNQSATTNGTNTNGSKVDAEFTMGASSSSNGGVAGNAVTPFVRGAAERSSLILKSGLVKAKVARFEAGVSSHAPKTEEVTTRSLEMPSKQNPRPMSLISTSKPSCSILSSTTVTLQSLSSVGEDPPSSTPSVQTREKVSRSMSSSSEALSKAAFMQPSNNNPVAPVPVQTQIVTPPSSRPLDTPQSSQFPVDSNDGGHNCKKIFLSSTLPRPCANSTIPPVSVECQITPPTTSSPPINGNPVISLNTAHSSRPGLDVPSTAYKMSPMDGAVCSPAVMKGRALLSATSSREDNHDAQSAGAGDSVPPMSSKSAASGESVLQRAQSHLGKLQRSMGSSSMRNALLSWCQGKLASYTGVEVTNFSSSWSDGLALCGLLHSYLPSSVVYADLLAATKRAAGMTGSSATAARLAARRRCYETAFQVAASVGIDFGIGVDTLLGMESTEWRPIMNLVTHVFMHFEVDHAPGACV